MLVKMVKQLYFLDFLEPEKQHYSTDPKRKLIGDDEHGWVISFNF